jgi:hypothetical protein
LSDPFFDQTIISLDGDGTSGANNNVFRDSSNNNFAITRVSNTTQGSFSPFSPSGWSNYLFENRIVYTASGVIPQPLTPWSTGTGTGTMEAWIYPTAIDGTGGYGHTMSTIVGIGDTYFAFGVRNDLKLRLYWWTGSQNNIDSTGTIPGLNQWIHVAVTRNNSNIQFFINGVSAGTSASYTGISSWGPGSGGESLQIGQNNGSGASADFYGYISNLRFSNSVRSISLPTADYTSDGNTLMLTCMSNRFRDIGPNNYTLTTAGTPKAVNFSPFAPSTSYLASTHGGSAYFDGGGDDRLTIPDNDTAFNLGTGNYTMEAWVYPMSSGITSGSILNQSIGGASSDSAFFVSCQTDGVAHYVSDGTSWDYNATNSSLFLGYQWNHVAWVRNGAIIYIYVNGVQQASTTVGGGFTVGNSSRVIEFGSQDGSSNFKGFIGPTRFVKGTALYTGTFTPPTAPFDTSGGPSLVTNFTNAGIYDWTTRSVIETIGNVSVNTTIAKTGTGSIRFNTPIGPKLRIPESPLTQFGTEDFTIECWYYPITKPDIAPCHYNKR